MISYTHASIYSSALEEFVLKIHGQDGHDMFIQLGDFVTMKSWQVSLNQDLSIQHSNAKVFGRLFSSTSTSATIQHQAAMKYHSTIREEDSRQESQKSVVLDEGWEPPHFNKGRRRSKSLPLEGESDVGCSNTQPILSSLATSLSSTLSSNVSPGSSFYRKRSRTYNSETE